MAISLIILRDFEFIGRFYHIISYLMYTSSIADAIFVFIILIFESSLKQNGEEKKNLCFAYFVLFILKAHYSFNDSN